MKYIIKRTFPLSCALIFCATLLSANTHAGLGIPRAEVCHAPSAAKTVAMNRIWDTSCGTFGRFTGYACEKANPFPNFDKLWEFCVTCHFDNTCEEYWGDPHVISSDGLRYDFQMSGDFALIESEELSMQIRLYGTGRVSYVRGVALVAGDDSIVIDYSQNDSDTPFVTLNGEAITFENGDWYDLSNEGDFIQRLGRGYRVSIDGLVRFGIRRNYLRMNLDGRLDDALNGMLGSRDGDPSNDLRTADGNPIDPSDRSQTGALYTSFASDWAREDDASMFPIPLPARVPFEGEASLADIDAATLDSARLECINAGVRPGYGLQECIYDVAVTGDTSLAQDALSLSPGIGESISAAALSTANLSSFALADVDSVSSDVPSLGAGRLEQSNNVDEFTFAVPTGETRLLSVREPCADDASLNATLLSEGSILREVNLGCDELIELSSDIDALRVFSAYGLALDYAFDIVSPDIQSIGAIDIGQFIQGSVARGQVLSGSFSLDPGTIVYGRTRNTENCGGHWKISDNTGAVISDEALLCEDLGLFTLTGSAPYQLRITGVADLEDYNLQLVLPDAAAAGLSAPTNIAAGAEITVNWTGPALNNDYIAIARVDQPQGNQYEEFAYLSDASNDVTLTVPGTPGDYEIRYVVGSSRQILARQSLTVEEVTASLSANTNVGAGAALVVQWTGPGNSLDYISIARTDQTAGNQYETFAFVSEDSDTVTLTVPGTPGNYLLRYVLNSDRQILAEQALIVESASAVLTANTSAEAGSELTVQWSGPANDGDYISIALIPDQSSGGQYETFAYAVSGESEVSLTVPGVPGSYELRYVLSSDREIIASQALTVTAASASVNAAPSAEAGSALTVQWNGPANDGDYISIALIPDQSSGGQYETFAYAVNGESEVSLTVPGIPGTYELRYVLSSDRQIIATQSLTVTAATASLTAPSSVDAGSQITVQWSGPANDRDYISIASLPDQTRGGQYETFAYAVDGESEVTLTVPGIPGDYELRYVLDSDRQIIATQALTIDPVSATLSGPASVTIGSDFVVTWTGPGNFRDFITIATSEQTSGGQYEDFAYTSDSSNDVTLTAPDIAGTYELRYILDSDNQIIEMVTIEVVN